MTGKEIIEEIQTRILECTDKDAIICANEAAHYQLLDIHSRALAAHCECLALNAENCISASQGCDEIPYDAMDFAKVLEKWSIIDEQGKPLI